MHPRYLASVASILDAVIVELVLVRQRRKLRARKFCQRMESNAIQGFQQLIRDVHAKKDAELHPQTVDRSHGKKHKVKRPKAAMNCGRWWGVFQGARAVARGRALEAS
jgi:hypothetical protein